MIDLPLGRKSKLLKVSLKHAFSFAEFHFRLISSSLSHNISTHFVKKLKKYFFGFNLKGTQIINSITIAFNVETFIKLVLNLQFAQKNDAISGYRYFFSNNIFIDTFLLKYRD